jgi:hypothetical protein
MPYIDPNIGPDMNRSLKQVPAGQFVGVEDAAKALGMQTPDKILIQELRKIAESLEQQLSAAKKESRRLEKKLKKRDKLLDNTVTVMKKMQLDHDTVREDLKRAIHDKEAAYASKRALEEYFDKQPPKVTFVQERP